MEIKEYIEKYKEYLNTINYNEVDLFVNRILKSYSEDKNIFIIGNGGSASNASHLAQDLSMGTLGNQSQEKRIKAISLTDNISSITALANDNGFENIFTSQLKNYASKGDILIAISCSGNSKNILNAVEYALSKKMEVIGVTGFDGGKLKQISDYSVHIPVNDFGIVESLHSIIFHFLVFKLRDKIKSLADNI